MKRAKPGAPKDPGCSFTIVYGDRHISEAPNARDVGIGSDRGAVERYLTLFPPAQARRARGSDVSPLHKQRTSQNTYFLSLL